MKSPTFRDIERLSAYLDGQLNQPERTRLERRLRSDPALAAALEELRQTRALLHRTPQRRSPRNFTLTPRMAGIRPPVPRSVPVLSWASAVAMVLFICTFGASLAGQLSFGASAPMMAAAPNSLAGAAPATAAPATMAPAAAAPATAAPAGLGRAVLETATVAPVAAETAPQAPVTDNTLLPTPTVTASVMAAPKAAPPAMLRATEPAPAPQARHKPLNLWLFIWPGLAVLLVASAILIQWLNKRAFQRKNPPR
jgi:hypothetical protein